MEINSFRFEGKEIRRPFVIAGPCSAESEDQMIGTARLLASQGVEVFRAGIWKPRTKPGGFEGVGSAGLEWLKIVKEETGLKTTTEVANSRHVEDALKAGVDILWIGARTTANPFAVQLQSTEQHRSTVHGSDVLSDRHHYRSPRTLQ